MKYTIKVPNPCSENWNAMNTTEKGRFCLSCKKEVIDYRFYSKDQLVKTLNSNVQVCGRFSLNQLEKELYSGETSRWYQMGLFIGFSSLFIATPAFSQNEKTKTEFVEYKVKRDNNTKISNEYIEFFGKILENPIGNGDKSYPIPGVNITQKATNNTVQSNLSGDFTIRIPATSFRDKVVLEFNYIGMETQEMEVFKTKNNLQITMQMTDALMGEVVFVKTKRKNIFTRIGNIFK